MGSKLVIGFAAVIWLHGLIVFHFTQETPVKIKINGWTKKNIKLLLLAQSRISKILTNEEISYPWQQSALLKYQNFGRWHHRRHYSYCCHCFCFCSTIHLYRYQLLLFFFKCKKGYQANLKHFIVVVLFITYFTHIWYKQHRSNTDNWKNWTQYWPTCSWHCSN